jgi:rhamnulose-1-phosphate aldolase
MNILDAQFVNDFIQLADDGFKQGWHEKNGGNLSYHMTKNDVEMVREHFCHGEWHPIKTTVPGLAGEYFLVTGSGKYFQNVKRKPLDSICVIELDGSGENYRIVWGLVNGGLPTSELPTHLMNHEVKMAMPGVNKRVLYHAHPANIVALTFVLPLDDAVFTRELWEMMMECPLVFPEGLGVTEWMPAGGREIAEITCEKMKKYNAVLWAHHGLFAFGDDFDEAFGLFHTIEKSAEILVKVLSMRETKRQTVSAEGLKSLAKAYNLTLPEEFLYEKD